jgi:hypothetical protein
MTRRSGSLLGGAIVRSYLTSNPARVDEDPSTVVSCGDARPFNFDMVHSEAVYLLVDGNFWRLKFLHHGWGRQAGLPRWAGRDGSMLLMPVRRRMYAGQKGCRKRLRTWGGGCDGGR